MARTARKSRAERRRDARQARVPKTREPAATQRPASRIWAIQASVIALAALLIYWPSLSGDWLWDDHTRIAEPGAPTRSAILLIEEGNTLPRQLARRGSEVIRSSDALWAIWTHPVNDDYWPLTVTLEWLIFRAFGADSTVPYHVAGLALHVLSTYLLWCLLMRLGVGANYAWLGALLFLTHPTCVPSAAAVSELKNTLSQAFLLGAMLAWLRFSQRERTRDYCTALALFLCSALSKTSVVMFPCVILLYAWYDRGRISQKDVVRAIPFFVASFTLGLVTMNLQGENVDIAISFGDRVLLAGIILWHYVYIFLWPFNLMFLYPYWQNLSAIYLAAWPAIALVAWLLWRKRKRPGIRVVMLGLGFWSINLIPVTGLIAVPVHFDSSPVGDYMTYVSILGAVGLVAAAAGHITQRYPAYKTALHVVAAIVVCLYAFESRGYAAKFDSNDALWEYQLEANPKSPQAHSAKGGRCLDARDYDCALYHTEMAVRLEPGYLPIRYNYAMALLFNGKTDAAAEQFTYMLRAQPRNEELKRFIVPVLVQARDYDKATELLDAMPTYRAGSGKTLTFSGAGVANVHEFSSYLKAHDRPRHAALILESVKMYLQEYPDWAPGQCLHDALARDKNKSELKACLSRASGPGHQHPRPPLGADAPPASLRHPRNG